MNLGGQAWRIGTLSRWPGPNMVIRTMHGGLDRLHRIELVTGAEAT
ncbi:MAG: hypothetical protein IPO61_07505 [Gammaproteobacteria bacterium]|nr:hypothetical protein [Gammaproteobacteria bacterium]